MAVDPSQAHAVKIERNGQYVVLVWDVRPPNINLMRSIKDAIDARKDVQKVMCRYYTRTGTLRFYITFSDMVQVFVDKQLQRLEQDVVDQINRQLYGNTPPK